MKKKLRDAIYIRLSDYNRKRLEVVAKEFESNLSDVAREAIEASLDKVFKEHPLLSKQIKENVKTR